MKATDLLKLIENSKSSKSVPGELGKQSYQNDNTPNNHVKGKGTKEVTAKAGGEKNDKKPRADVGSPKKREKRSMEGPGTSARRMNEALSAKEIGALLQGTVRDPNTGGQAIQIQDQNRGQVISVPLSNPRTYTTLLNAIKGGDDNLANRAYNMLVNSPDASVVGGSAQRGKPGQTMTPGQKATAHGRAPSKSDMRGGVNVYKGDADAAKQGASRLSLANGKGSQEKKIRESGAERGDSMGKEKAAAGGPVSKSATVKTMPVDKKPTADVGKVKKKEKRSMGENPAPVKDYKGGENEHKSMKKMHEAISDLSSWLGSDLNLLEGDLPVHGLDSDQPSTCPKCGTRTDFEDHDSGKQHHKCPNPKCGYEFHGEFDEAEGDYMDRKKKIAGRKDKNGIQPGTDSTRVPPRRGYSK